MAEIYLKDRKVGYTVSLIRLSRQGTSSRRALLKLNLMGLGRNLTPDPGPGR